jgi:16S rRNA (guanine966-N2)-methyltransferase
MDVLRFLGDAPGSSNEQFDLVLFDPPYKSDLGVRALKLLVEHDWLREGAVVILEADSRKEAPTCPPDLAFRARRRYGDTSLYIFDYCT